MSNKRISELGLVTNPSISDVYPIVHQGTTSATSIGSAGNAILNANFPITSSGILVNGDINITGNISASAIISELVIYDSGSTIFGDSMDDTHQFTGSIYLTGSMFGVEHLGFLTNHIDTPVQGELCWNDDDTTLNLGITNDVTLQLGQELHYPKVVNKDSVDILNGTLLMIRTTDITQGQRLAVVRWDGTQGYPADYIVGIATSDIPINQEGFVTWFGYVRGISISDLEDAGVKDENETWDEGEILYPHPTLRGGLTNVKPTSPNVKSTIAVTTAVNGNNLTILVRPKFGSRITELYDVDFDTAVTGSIIYKGSQGDGSRWGTTENSIKVVPPHLILTEVSESLNFANDGLAAAGGVPLGGLYRNGNVIQIRIV